MLIPICTIYSGTTTTTGATAWTSLPPNCPPIKAVKYWATGIAGTTPTFDIVVQTSDDGLLIEELETFGATSGSSDQGDYLYSSGFTTPDALAMCRCNITVGGTGGPTADIVVELYGEAPTE